MGKDAEDGKALVKHKDKDGKKDGNRRDRRKAAAVDNTFRRTWDKDEFEDKAAEREKVPLCLSCVVPLVSKLTLPSGPGGAQKTVCCTQVAKAEEESALDAKRRKRLGAPA